MKITDLIKKDTIILNLESSHKEGALLELINKLNEAGRLNNLEEFKNEILRRESLSSTGIGEGIAIPHAKTWSVNTPAIAFARSVKGIEFDSIDGNPAHLIFMIAYNEGAHNEHLKTLSKLSTLLLESSFRRKILEADSEEEILILIDAKEKGLIEEKEEEGPSEIKEKILAVTACPTGIAHTYMAAEALKSKCRDMDIDIKVETNGSTGVENKLSDKEISEAISIIVATDRQVEMDRFDGKVVIQVSTAEAINKPEELINRALNKEGKIFKGNKNRRIINEDNGEVETYKFLMNGISSTLPFIVVGGILLSLAYLFDPQNLGSINYGSGNPIAKFLMDLGMSAFVFMLPVLSGFIASSIADRPGLVPGFIGGSLAYSNRAGFLGALIAGFMAGYVVLLLKRLLRLLPASLEGIKAVLLLPVIGVLLVGIAMKLIIIPPVEVINVGINTWLSALNDYNKILLGLLLGGMMAVDMGGPVNKAAYVFGVASLTEGNGEIMAAVMAGGIVPPLGIAIATSLFESKFTRSERQAGKANYIMGLSFITEGAIPFALSDPKAVIPSIIVGSSIAGALSMIFDASSPSPHGGILILLLISNWPFYILSILIGSIITAILLNILRK